MGTGVGGLLDEDRAWLENQPGMNPWQDGCAMLRQSLDTWLGQYLGAIGLDAPTIACPAAEPGQDSSLIADRPPTDGRYTYSARLWRCWCPHWQQAITQPPGGLVDGRDVARQIQRHEGFLGSRQLGGDPLRDVVLAEAVQQRGPTAMRTFEQEYKDFCIAQGVVVNRRVLEDRDDWWYCLLDHLAGYSRPPGKLAGFSGKCGLKFWLATVARNFAHQYPPLPKDTHEDALDCDCANGQATNVAEEDECLDLLGGFVRTGLADLPADDQAVLYLLHVEQLPGKDAARVLGIDAGTVTRRKQKASTRLQTLMLERAEQLTQRQAYEDCLEVISQRRNWRHFTDIFCETLQQLGSEVLHGHRAREVSR